MANQSYNPISYAGGSGGSGVTLAFSSISTTGQTVIEADTATDTLYLSAMGSFAIEHHATTDTIILSAGVADVFDSSDLVAASGNWNQTFTDVKGNSANWVSTHTDVNANSANWSYASANSATINDFDIMMIAEVFR